MADTTKFRRGGRPAREAWDKWPYVEAHPPHTYAGLFFDIDHPDKWEFDVEGPCPNWQGRKDGRRPASHVAFTLETPVARHDAARLQPLGFYRRVYDGLAVKFGADLRYDGLMIKNPRPPPGCSVQWLRKEPYGLDELREWLFERPEKPIISTGVGRNEDMFRYCVSIAKSCAKYSLRNFREPTFSQIQSHRSTRRWHPDQPNYDYGDRAETVGLVVEQGYSQSDIAEKFGVSVRTAKRDLRTYRERM